jgi:hypothetical protein
MSYDDCETGLVVKSAESTQLFERQKEMIKRAREEKKKNLAAAKQRKKEAAEDKASGRKRKRGDDNDKSEAEKKRQQKGRELGKRQRQTPIGSIDGGGRVAFTKWTLQLCAPLKARLAYDYVQIVSPSASSRLNKHTDYSIPVTVTPLTFTFILNVTTFNRRFFSFARFDRSRLACAPYCQFNRLTSHSLYLSLCSYRTKQTKQTLIETNTQTKKQTNKYLA